MLQSTNESQYNIIINHRHDVGSPRSTTPRSVENALEGDLQRHAPEPRTASRSSPLVFREAVTGAGGNTTSRIDTSQRKHVRGGGLKAVGVSACACVRLIVRITRSCPASGHHRNKRIGTAISGSTVQAPKRIEQLQTRSVGSAFCC